MQLLDWIILCSTLLLIVAYGTLKTKGAKNSVEYIKGGNEAKWWTVGLSVMATQASAITFLSTPGQAFNDGMGFVQFYFGLPIAIIIICIVFIPIYHKLKVFTAYEYLESRFDLKTRTLTSVLFLIQRSLAAGITIFAPAIILSSVLGWDLTTLNIIIGLLVIIYTVSGGTKAVNYTQKYQMGVIFTGLIITFLIIINSLPDNVTFEKAIELAGANDKMKILGMRAVGEHASSTIQGIGLLMKMDKNIQELAEMVHPHPSIIEGIQECVRMLLNKSIFKSSIFKDKLWCYRRLGNKIENLQRL